jgi:hypothetical protein
MYLVKIILLLIGQCSRPLLLFAWWYVQLLRLHILSLINYMLLVHDYKDTSRKPSYFYHWAIMLAKINIS